MLALAALAALAFEPAAAQQPAIASSGTGDIAPCIAELREQAANRGIAGTAFDGWLAGVEPDASALELLDRQPEFTIQPWDYIAMLVDEKRIAEGRRKLASLSGLLDRIEQAYGVDRHVLVALWGVESRFGEQMGSRPLVRSLATLSCYGRRQPFFREELMMALRILQDGDVEARQLTGSWAGAFGHTQFMPSTFRRVAVDFDGDGRRDLVQSVADALASSANYLAKEGWKRGEPWGYEVRVPRKYDGPSGRRTRLSMAQWRAHAVRRVDGRALPDEGTAALLLPAGVNGPAFLVLGNFNALLAYNPSEMYANCMTERSYTECTASCVAGLARFRDKYPKVMRGEIDAAIARGVELLRSRQRADGSWLGCWGVIRAFAQASVQGAADPVPLPLGDAAEAEPLLAAADVVTAETALAKSAVAATSTAPAGGRSCVASTSRRSSSRSPTANPT
jgi:lytic murein transglycosylase